MCRERLYWAFLLSRSFDLIKFVLSGRNEHENNKLVVEKKPGKFVPKTG